MGDLPFTAEEIQLKPGTLLFLYTDGLTDATNTSEKMFELERVKNVLLQTAEWQQDEESASYVRKMTDEVAAFVGDAPQADDLTMLVIRWKGQKQI